MKITSLALGFLSLLAFSAAGAEELAPKPRIAKPSPGMSSMDLIVYTVNAVEYGADKTGIADSTEAIQRALDACRNVEGGTVFLPAGKYKVEGRLNVEGGCTLRGEWVNPEQPGGLGKGTILMVYAGRDDAEADSDPGKNAFLTVRSGACARDLSFWYPEQKAGDIRPYPATIRGDGHSDAINITFYNSYCGFWNNDCSSMLIRRMYGTVLKLGVHGAYAYDIPRIEHVHFDTRFWAQSGLPDAPRGADLVKLNMYCEENLVCMQGGEQDWGYWWDFDFNHCKWGCFLTAVPDRDRKKLVPGNIAAGKVRTRNCRIGFYLENVGYPGFQLTYGDVEAKEYGMYYPPKPDYSKFKEQGIKPAYYENATIVVTGVKFSGGKAAFMSEKQGRYNLNFADCRFSGHRACAIGSLYGSITASRCEFSGSVPAFNFADTVDQAVATGNVFGPSVIAGWNPGDERFFRDDADKRVPRPSKFEWDWVCTAKPRSDRIFDVSDFGAKRGTVEKPPAEDSAAAIQQALNAAAATGGTVYVPAGVYRLDAPLKIPSGVELRGSFESAHYGNSTDKGTVLWVYCGRDKENDPPLVTMSKGSGFKGFTVLYPEQGWTDNQQYADEKSRVKKYPPTVRTASDCWVQNNTIVCCYGAIDAMTVKSDNLSIVDVTGAAMLYTLHYGHGAVDGHVQNLHFNYSNWTHQWRFPNRIRNAEDGTSGDKLLCDYTTRNVNGLVLGDVKRTGFFSCFNIIVSDQIVLEKDPFTGGSFKGKMWGVAFDAAANGIVGRDGSEGVIAIIASMGVFNQQGGGFYIKTDPGFKGRIFLYNADVWSGKSRLSDVKGGEANFIQLFAWCCYEGYCHGGALNVLGSTIVGNNDNDHEERPDFSYDPGTKGVFTGNLHCRKRLRVDVAEGADVKKGVNGFAWQPNE